MSVIDMVEINKELIPQYIGFELELAGVSIDSLISCLGAKSRFTVARDDSIKIIENELCPYCDEQHKVIKSVFGAELVSPKTHTIYLYKSLKEAARILKTSISLGAHVNITCGTHVHIDSGLFDTDALMRCLLVYISMEDAAYKYFLGDLDQPRVLWVDRHNFAKSMRKFVEVDVVDFGIKALNNMEDKYWGWYVSNRDHSGEVRHTVEYRLFNGTMDIEKLLEMVKFSLGCSYLGLTRDFKPYPASYYSPNSKAPSISMALLEEVIELGDKLLEAANVPSQ